MFSNLIVSHNLSGENCLRATTRTVHVLIQRAKFLKRKELLVEVTRFVRQAKTRIDLQVDRWELGVDLARGF